jgi:hypothetical protein
MYDSVYDRRQLYCFAERKTRKNSLLLSHKERRPSQVHSSSYHRTSTRRSGLGVRSNCRLKPRHLMGYVVFGHQLFLVVVVLPVCVSPTRELTRAITTCVQHTELTSSSFIAVTSACPARKAGTHIHHGAGGGHDLCGQQRVRA